ncbi:MAG: hypothetical protein QOG28_2891 [Trebonia sp.]|nr:hypothetical protein [Trebonia sp.]
MGRRRWHNAPAVSTDHPWGSLGFPFAGTRRTQTENGRNYYIGVNQWLIDDPEPPGTFQKCSCKANQACDAVRSLFRKHNHSVMI